MYDAKKEDLKNENEQLKYNCISTRSYFQNEPNCSIMNLKTSSIPIDNIFY